MPTKTNASRKGKFTKGSSTKQTRYKFALNPNYTLKFRYQIYESVGLGYNDILGAIFAATRHVIPSCSLDILQRHRRVGRIQVELVKNNDNYSTGYVEIPLETELESALLIAAAIEAIPTIGPFKCLFKIDVIANTTAGKLSNLINRAVELYKTKLEFPPTVANYREMLKKKIQNASMIGLPDNIWAGVGYRGPQVIVVQGRNDVKRLVDMGRQNVMSCNGLNCPVSFFNCIESKKVTLLLDGDRGGTLILAKIVAKTSNPSQLNIAQVQEGKKIEQASKQQVDLAMARSVKWQEGVKTYHDGAQS